MYISNNLIDVIANGLTILITAGMCLFLIISGVHFVRESYKYGYNLICKISSISFLISTILFSTGLANLFMQFIPDTKTSTSIITILGFVGFFAMFISAFIMFVPGNFLPDSKSDKKIKTN